jgi:hypothetical protein
VQIFADGGIRARDLLHGKQARYYWANRALIFFNFGILGQFFTILAKIE